MDEGKVDHRFDLAKQVILRNQTLETDHLECGLLRRRFAKHAPSESKVPANGEDFVISLEWPRKGPFFFAINTVRKNKEFEFVTARSTCDEAIHLPLRLRIASRHRARIRATR